MQLTQCECRPSFRCVLLRVCVVCPLLVAELETPPSAVVSFIQVMTSIWCQHRQAPLCDVQVLNPTLSIQLAALVPLSRRGCGSGTELGGPSDRQLLLNIAFSTLALWFSYANTQPL